MAKTYICFNGPMPTVAAGAPVATGAVIITLLQLKPALPIKVIEWGISFSGFAAAAPGKVELLTTGVIYGTVTAFAAADVMPYDDPNAPVNTAGVNGVPLNLGVTESGYTCTNEAAIVATRYGDVQQISPTGQYVKQFPLGREFGVPALGCLRVRVTFAASVYAVCYVIFEP